MEKPVVVAMVVGKYVGGGVESVVLNYYRFINKKNVQFDFIFDSDSIDIPYKEIESLGGKIIICPPYQKIFKYISFLKKLFKEKKYEIVHSHINTLSVFPLFAAKKAGVPVRIAHSHSTSNKKEWKRNIIKNILRHFSKIYANVYFACSKEAAIYQFGKKAFMSGKIHIINNAIDIDKFKYDEEKRNTIRKELKISEECLLIGHVGRFVTVKNHDFILNLFKEVHSQNKKTKLVLVGQGPLFNHISDEIKMLGLDDSVILTGQRKDINSLYSAMDLFILPSLYEGLGLALIEAQASGLKCIASTMVPQEANVGNLVEYIPLEEKELWKRELTNCKADRVLCDNIIIKNGYDIKTEAKKLENYYIRSTNKKR